MKDVILFSHAFTESATYHRGKRTFLNMLKKKTELIDDVVVFNNANAAKEDIR